MPSHVLSLTDEKPPAGVSGSGLMYSKGLLFLEKSLLAQSERKGAKGIDSSYLARFDGTDLVQWFGRRSDGCFHPFGRIMRIYAVSDEPIP